MDDKNIEILVKNRTEEIRNNREESNKSKEETDLKEENRIDEELKKIQIQELESTIKKINKVQKRNIFWKLLAIILLILLAVIFYLNENLKTKVESLENEVVSLLSTDSSYTYEGMQLEGLDLIRVDNRVLVSVDFVIDLIDENIHYSNSGSRVYIPLENLDFELETRELTKYIKKNIVDINVPILVKNSVKYIDFEVVKILYGIDYIYANDGSFAMYSDSYANIVVVNSKEKFVKSDEKETSITENDKDVKAIVLGVHKNLSKIITENGRIGYVETSKLKSYNYEYKKNILNESREDFDYGDNLNMTWSQISQYKNNPNLSLDETVPGLDAISPTWFSLNINGIVINEADFRYMKSAHEKGYKVWGLFSNSFKPSWTSEMLNDDVYRRRSIAQIAFYSALYDLDGVNIDYENMYLDDQDKFTQFIAELSSVLKEQNVVLSIAVTVPGGSDQWSKVYDRKSLAKHVDFMMLMAYDEFWASSPISGPVASIPWVIKGIEESLELIPAEKLILGIPLYMRIWKESGNSVSSKAIGIKHLEEVLEDKDYVTEYDSDNMVNYISYREDGALKRIWVEDELSLEKRIMLSYKYKLSGIGTWSKEFVEYDTWEVINNLLN